MAADGKSVTWKLKQDVKWSDGTAFTAQDVVFTYEFLSNPKVGATSAGTYEVVESVEAIDDHTVKVNFKEVNPAWSLVFVGWRRYDSAQTCLSRLQRRECSFCPCKP